MKSQTERKKRKTRKEINLKYYLKNKVNRVKRSAEENHKYYIKYRAKNKIEKKYYRIIDTDRGLVFFPGIGMTFKEFTNLPINNL